MNRIKYIIISNHPMLVLVAETEQELDKLVERLLMDISSDKIRICKLGTIVDETFTSLWDYHVARDKIVNYGVKSHEIKN